MDPQFAAFDADSLALVEYFYEQYRHDPSSVSQTWRVFFADMDRDHKPNGDAFTPTAPQGTLFRPTTTAAAVPAHSKLLEVFRHASPERTALYLPYVKKLALFSALQDADQRLVAGIIEEIPLSDGERLFAVGDPGDALYFIASGGVSIKRGSQLIARLHEGEVVGEMAIIDQRPRSADVYAYGETLLLRLDAECLDALLDAHASIARTLFHISSQRLRETAARQERVDQLIRAYRVRGHMVADLDPLGRRSSAHPELELAYHGLSEADLDLPFAARTWHGSGTFTLRSIMRRLQATYCRSIGVQFMHIDNLDVTRWLQERMETCENHLELSRDQQHHILRKLTDAEVFEQFVHKNFLGAKRFSLEGGESLIPLLHMALDTAAEHGITAVVIGMPHRGRLNVLANVMGKDPREIFREFKDSHKQERTGGGDVKYHLGYSNEHTTLNGKNVHLSLCFNPSHLEFVNPVVAGRVRAKQDRLKDLERKHVMPLLIHGDAAFAGQGVVQELFNMSQLPGYQVGGTVHIIVNNQIGFTTPPESARSCQYATDIAKMLDIPIFHVNGEDPEGVAQAIHLALDFRQKFQRDVVIDMYCYRKYGHNEGDEPTFTQPVMYEHIRSRPTVRQNYLANLVRMGDLSDEEGLEVVKRSQQRLEAALVEAQDGTVEHQPPGQKLWRGYRGGDDDEAPRVDTGLSKEVLVQLAETQTHIPDTFTIHPKLQRLMQTRLEMVRGEKPLDWGAGENLAFASLVSQGIRVRISGQDSGRGTFSHRHAVLHDQHNDAVHIPLQHLHEGQAPFDVIDSPLSETGVLGFDWGYSLDTPDGLIVWEAQFGDFANGAQVIIDQFITSSEDKWQRLSGLVMLLPHGFEGQGPEHSSARLERFLQLAAADNIQVVTPTTPAQIFHLLRQQMLRLARKPLVVMSPKVLLRLPEASSPIADLTHGTFQRIIGDDSVKTDKPPFIVLCAGKVYYDLLKYRNESKIDTIPLIRMEQFYPRPEDELLEVLERYPAGTPVRWVQEEPINMGGWPFMTRYHMNNLLGRHPMSVIARPESASPAVGSAKAHAQEQNIIVQSTFAL